jgi:hypothetical protein
VACRTNGCLLEWAAGPSQCLNFCAQFALALDPTGAPVTTSPTEISTVRHCILDPVTDENQTDAVITPTASVYFAAWADSDQPADGDEGCIVARSLTAAGVPSSPERVVSRQLLVSQAVRLSVAERRCARSTEAIASS